MSSTLYKAVCARLLQVNFTQHVNLCCLCLETVGESRACVEDEVVLNLPGRPFHRVKLSSIFKFLLGENFSEVMFILRYVCKQCISSAIAGYKFIQCCKDNAKKLTDVIENLEESLDEIIPNDKINCKSLYIALQPSNNSKTLIKRYYDIRRQLIPEDTAFLRFTQIVESQKQSPETIQHHTEEVHEQKINKNEIDHTLQALMCCKTIVDINELLDNPKKPYEFRCKICKELFAKSTSLRVHFFRVHRRKNFKCDKCKAYSTQHAVTVNSTDLKHSFKRIQLKEEIDMHLPSEDDDCQINEQNQSKNGDQNKHFIRLVPTESLLWKGSRREVRSPTSLDAEAQYIVKGPTGTEHCCKNCGTKFSTRARYLIHKKQFKSNNCQRRKGRGEFKCDLCNFTAFYKHLVRRHIRFKHFGEKGHVCSYCNRNCHSKGELDVHLRKHTGEKPFKCHECGSKFTSSQGLKYHKFIHTGERPYKCELCNKAFRTASMAKEHFTRVHEPPSLRCEICGDWFNAKQDLLRHEFRHYSREPFKSRKKLIK